MPHRGEFRRVDVLAVGRDLGSGDREQRVAGLDVLPFLDMEVADDAFARRKHLHRAGSRDQKAGNGLLARELREAQENNRGGHNRRQQPSQQLGRDRLQQRDLAEVALPALKVDRFLTEQRLS